MTPDLAARLRKILPATPLPWKELPYKDGGRERAHIDYDNAYELAAANALPALLDRIEELEAQLERAASAWRPIATALQDRRLFFWLVPTPAEEAYCDTSGNPITSNFKPYRHEGSWKSWPATAKPIYWMDLPSPPEEP